MKYRDLRDFLAQLERRGELKRVARRGRSAARDDRDLRPRAEGGRAGAAVRAAEGAHDSGARQSVRHAAARRARHGVARRDRRRNALREHRQAARVPQGAGAAEGLARTLAEHAGPAWPRRCSHMAPKEVTSAPCQEIVWEGADVDLARLPIQTCWPGDAGAAHHLGSHRHARAAQEAPEPRHLPPAGDRAATR